MLSVLRVLTLLRFYNTKSEEKEKKVVKDSFEGLNVDRKILIRIIEIFNMCYNMEELQKKNGMLLLNSIVELLLLFSRRGVVNESTGNFFLGLFEKRGVIQHLYNLFEGNSCTFAPKNVSTSSSYFFSSSSSKDDYDPITTKEICCVCLLNLYAGQTEVNEKHLTQSQLKKVIEFGKRMRNKKKDVWMLACVDIVDDCEENIEVETNREKEKKKPLIINPLFFHSCTINEIQYISFVKFHYMRLKKLSSLIKVPPKNTSLNQQIKLDNSSWDGIQKNYRIHGNCNRKKYFSKNYVSDTR